MTTKLLGKLARLEGQVPEMTLVRNVQESMSAYHAIEESLDFREEDREEVIAIKKATKNRWLPQIQQENDQYRDSLHRVVRRVCNGAKVSEHLVLDCLLDLNQLRQQLAVNVLTWSAKLQDPSMYVVDLTKHVGDRPDTPFSGIGTQFADTALPERSHSLGAEVSLPTEEIGLEIPKESSFKIRNPEVIGSNPMSCPWSPYSSGNPWEDMKYESTVDNLSEGGNMTEDSCRKFTSPFAALIDRPFSPESSLSCESQDSQEVRTSLKVESFGIEASLERLPAISPSPNMNLFPIAMRQNSSSAFLHSMLDHEASQFLEDTKLDVHDNAHHRRWGSDPLMVKGMSLLEQLDRRLVKVEEGPFYNVPIKHLDGSIMKPKPYPILRTTPQIKNNLKSGVIPLANGFFQMNGRSLITSSVDDVVIPVFEAEPASIIAHVLASFAYQKDLQAAVEGIVASWTASSLPDVKAANEAASGQSSILLSKAAINLTQKFEDDPPGMPWSHARFQVVAYYAPQFAKLRDLCILGGEQSFIMSLSRCNR